MEIEKALAPIIGTCPTDTGLKRGAHRGFRQANAALLPSFRSCCVDPAVLVLQTRSLSAMAMGVPDAPWPSGACHSAHFLHQPSAFNGILGLIGLSGF